MYVSVNKTTTGSDNGLALNRRQAINNDDPVHLYMYHLASQGHNEYGHQ